MLVRPHWREIISIIIDLPLAICHCFANFRSQLHVLIFTLAFFSLHTLDATTLAINAASDGTCSFAPVVKRVAPSVVSVYTKQVVKHKWPSNSIYEPFFRHFFNDKFFDNVLPRERVASFLGSGVIIDPSGIVVTSYHVIKDATEVRVTLHDKRELAAKVILTDKTTDLALLQIIDKGTYHFVKIGDSDALQVGDPVLALGNPFGVGQTVTSGVISALSRPQVGTSDYRFFIQTDAAMNPGNSGGALVNTNAELVGVPSAIYSKSGGFLGIGFAVPSLMVQFMLNQTKSKFGIQRAWFGAELQTISFNLSSKLAQSSGALITRIIKNSPAMKAGLRKGDVIIGIDGTKIEDPKSFSYRLATKSVGKNAKLLVLRAGRQFSTNLSLVVAPELPPRDKRKLLPYSPLQGAYVVNLSPAVAEELQLPISSLSNGVAVFEVDNGSVAAHLGLTKGDIIIRVNDTEVSSTKLLAEITKSKPQLWVIEIKRGQKQFKLILR